jgi:ABC-type molybdate transport system substrate-binding protein
MQVSEIVAHDGVVLAAPLPAQLQRMTVYSAGLMTDSPNAVDAAAFLERMRSDTAREALRKGGFVLA